MSWRSISDADHAVAASDGKLYAIMADGTDVFEYDPDADTWSSVGDIPTDVSNHAVAVKP